MTGLEAAIDRGRFRVDPSIERWEANPQLRRDAWIAVCVGAASIFLFVVDSGIVALALPSIEAEFPTTPRSTVAWVASGFMIAQSSFLLIGGRLGDRRGRRRFYLVGLMTFSIGALLTALAPTLPLIIAARVIQGTGAALLTSSALALALPLFPRSKSASVVGVWGAVGSIAAWLTPTAGSYLIRSNWRLAFAVVAPIGVATAIVGRRVLVEQRADDQSGRTDLAGYLLGPPALGLLMLVLSRGNQWGWATTTTAGLGLLSVLLLVGFVRRCQVAATPLLDLEIVRNPRFLANIISGSFQQIGFYSWFLTGPLIMTNLWGWSVLQAGFALALGQVMSSVGSPLGGWLVGRYGYDRPIFVSSIVTGLGAMWLAVMATATADFWFTYLPAALLMGFGGGICGTVTTGAALSALPQSMLGAGNSVQQLARRVGGALGVAAAVALLGEATGPALLSGARRVWWMVAIIHCLMGVPLYLARRREMVADSPV